MSPGAAGKTRVFFTVDVECAEERVRDGSVQPPQGYDLRMWGRLTNQPHDLGVPLILRELDRCGLQGTFFLEPFGSSYFGEAGLSEVCREILGHGHDVQLHAHPVQRQVDWHTRGCRPAPDDLAAYEVGTQTALLNEGLEILGRCGVRREALLAFRAGHFGANNDTWAAMRAAGLSLSSSLNLAYLHKNCRIRWPTPANELFPAVEGVWELPVSNFVEAQGRYRPLQITAVSFAEMRLFLSEAVRRRLGEVTIVTHPFEYFSIDSVGERRGRPNWINIRRLRQLCDYLHEHRAELEVKTVGALATELRAGAAGSAAKIHPIPEGRPSLRYLRLAEQGLKRILARAPLR